MYCSSILETLYQMTHLKLMIVLLVRNKIQNCEKNMINRKNMAVPLNLHVHV